MRQWIHSSICGLRPCWYTFNVKSSAGVFLILIGSVVLNSCEQESDESGAGAYLEFPLKTTPLVLDVDTKQKQKEMDRVVIKGYWNTDILNALKRNYVKLHIKASIGPSTGEKTFRMDEFPNSTINITAKPWVEGPYEDLLQEIYGITANGQRDLIFSGGAWPQ